MKRYRIISNGPCFRAQTRLFWLFWLDLFWLGDSAPYKPVIYTTEGAARKAIERDKDSTVGRKWKEVVAPSANLTN